MTQEILYSMDGKRLTLEDLEMHRKLNKDIRKMCKNAREKYLQDAVKILMHEKLDRLHLKRKL